MSKKEEYIALLKGGGNVKKGGKKAPIKGGKKPCA